MLVSGGVTITSTNGLGCPFRFIQLPVNRLFRTRFMKIRGPQEHDDHGDCYLEDDSDWS